jgi:hypothetical protein
MSRPKKNARSNGRRGMRANPAASNICAEGIGATAKSAKLAARPRRLWPRTPPRTSRLSSRFGGSFAPNARKASASSRRPVVAATAPVMTSAGVETSG